MQLTSAIASTVLTLNAYAIAASTQPATRPDDDAAWQALSDGRQSDAERVVRRRLKNNPQDARAQFMAGLLVRSRFDKQGAAPYLDRVIKLSPSTDEAAAAKAVRALDNGGFFYSADKDFDILRQLADRHTEDGAYLWLLAIECRTYDDNEGGVAAYEKLAAHFKTGPVLFHQTYANLLDNLRQYDKSLPHRKEAVRLEPEPWSYSGLGDTYWRMGRPKDAIGPYQDALKMQPNNVEILRRLLINAIDAKDGAVAVDAGEHAALKKIFKIACFFSRHGATAAVQTNVDMCGPAEPILALTRSRGAAGTTAISVTAVWVICRRAGRVFFPCYPWPVLELAAKRGMKIAQSNSRSICALIEDRAVPCPGTNVAHRADGWGCH